MPDAQQAPIVVSADAYRQQQITTAKEQAVRDQLDYAPEGGRFRVNGEWVDANGEPCDPPRAAKAGKGE